MAENPNNISHQSKEVGAWLNNMKKAFGDDLHLNTQEIKRLDSGVYSLNSALGGGWAIGRMHLLVGKEGTGKSSVSAKTAANAQCTHRETGEYCDPFDPFASRVLYVDMEGTLDRDWCLAHGYHPEYGDNVVATVSTGNQAIDLINNAIQSKHFSLIILDSIEALIPHKDILKSSEDFVVGTKAKMNNDACRRWTVALTDAARTTENWWQRPTFIAINQLRDAISLMPSAPVIPGGIGQRQASSTIVQLNSPKYADDGKLGGKGVFKGVVKKNKTGTPRQGFEFTMNLSEHEEGGLGYVDNVQGIVRDIKSFKLWEKEGKEWNLFGYTAVKQEEFVTRMRSEAEFEREIMEKVIEAKRS
jgi:RecA/RadA recombinase